MVERGHGFGFALEAFRELGLRHLDGDDTIQPRVAGLVHFAHSTMSDQSVDLVRPEFVAGKKRHLDVRAKFSRSGRI